MPRCYFCGVVYGDEIHTDEDYILAEFHVHRPGALGRAGVGGTIKGAEGGGYATNPGVPGHYKREYPIAENIRWLKSGIALGTSFFIFTTRDDLANDIREHARRNTLLFEIMFLHAVGYSFARVGGRVVAERTVAQRLSDARITTMVEQAGKSLDRYPAEFWALWKDHFEHQVLPGFPAAGAHAPVPATAMFELELRDDANGMDAQFRGELNRSPQPIEITLRGQHVVIAATHWAWQQGRVLRVEAPADLEARFRLLPDRSALVAFPGFSLTVINITRSA
jgi:hypothetical protein